VHTHVRAHTGTVIRLVIEAFLTERMHDWLLIQMYQQDASGNKRFVPMQRCTHLNMP
jgi:hypothetical protein